MTYNIYRKRKNGGSIGVIPCKNKRKVNIFSNYNIRICRGNFIRNNAIDVAYFVANR